MGNNGFIKSFSCAVKGMRLTLSERNMRIHLSMAFYVIFFALWGGVEHVYYPPILLCIALVIGSEIINTSIERLCDRVTKEQDPAIGAAKDISAGAVLFCAAIAAVTGIMIFARPVVIERVIENTKQNIWILIPFFISIILFGLFIRGRKKSI